MLTTLRTLTTALMGSLFFIAVAMYFVFAPGTDPQPGEGLLDAPPTWVPVAQLAAGVVLHLLIGAIGYRAPAISPGTPPETAGRTSAAALSSGTILRAAMAESVAIGSLALAFLLTEGSYVTYLGGAVVSLVLFALHAFPSERTISRTETSLERDGGTSYLRHQLGRPAPSPGGAIQEL